MKEVKQQLLLFILFLVLFTAIFFFFLSVSKNYYFYMIGYMWSPALATLTVVKLTGKDIKREIFWSWGKTSFQFLSFVIPLLYGLLVYMIIWVFAFGQFDFDSLDSIAKKIGMESIPMFIVVPVYVILRGLAGTLGNMPSSMGEELGWRGFLTQKLMKVSSYPIACLLTGLIWGIWHFPLIIKNHDSSAPLPLWSELLNFTVLTIGLSFILTWLLIKSKSVWTAVVLHSAHNVFILSIFEGFTTETTRFSGESGYLLPLVCLIVGLIFWLRYNNLTSKKDEQLGE